MYVNTFSDSQRHIKIVIFFLFILVEQQRTIHNKLHTRAAWRISFYWCAMYQYKITVHKYHLISEAKVNLIIYMTSGSVIYFDRDTLTGRTPWHKASHHPGIYLKHTIKQHCTTTKRLKTA